MNADSVAGADSKRVFDVIVVGAGISGLVAAHRLKRSGRDVRVIDAGARPGGVIGSVARDGCLFERGPNSALDTTPLIGELVASLGLAGELRFASEAAEKRYVVRGGVLTALPTSPRAFLSSRLFSPSAKLALLREPFLRPAAPDTEESIAAFVRRRLGTEFLDYAIDPFVAGIYAGDPEQIFGARERRRQKETAKNSAKSFSFAGGMQVLTDALAATLGPIALHARATRLERDGGGTFTLQAEHHGEPLEWRARAVLLATPADRAAALVREHAGDAAAALDAIAYAPVATVASAYAAASVAHLLDGFGCLVPRKERRRVLGVLFSSTMFEGRAPAGTALLTTFIGGQRQPDLPGLAEADVAALAHAEHAALLGARAEPLFQAVTRWPRAIPQYTLGHLDRVARAEAAARALPGLFFCASWKGGVSVGDCIRNGHLEADAVAAFLRPHV
jgi:oxygen-dependent protoporphyrinogen oxidase